MISAVLLLGCSGGPAQIDYVDQISLYDQNVVRPDATVRDGKGRLLPGSAVHPVASSDERVVEVLDGGFACRGSGAATVTLQVDELTQDVDVRCHLVGRIEVRPSEIEVVLDLVESVLDPVELEALVVRVYDEADNAVDVPVQVVSSNDKIVSLGPNDVLEVLAPGRVQLSVTAGGKTESVSVVVGEVISSQGIAVGEASITTVPVRPGSWAWTLRADDLISMELGDCEVQPPSEVVEGRCELPKGGEMVISNHGRGLRRVALRLVRLPD